jgi:hypothetical protein
MTDVLAERFAAVADDLDDGDWREIARRGNRRRLTAGAIAFVALAAVAAALAANDRWHFFDQGNGDVKAVTTIDYAGGRWTVELEVAPSGLGGATEILRSPAGKVVASAMGGPLLTPRGRTHVLVESSTYADRHGTIAFGLAAKEISAIRVVRRGGKTTSVATVAARPQLLGAARVWAVAVRGRISYLEALDEHGKRRARFDAPGSGGSIVGYTTSP